MTIMRNHSIYPKNLFRNANTFNREFRDTGGLKSVIKTRKSVLQVETTCCLEGGTRHAGGEKETMRGKAET